MKQMIAILMGITIAFSTYANTKTFKVIILVDVCRKNKIWKEITIFGGLLEDILPMDGWLIEKTEETAKLVELLSVAENMKKIYVKNELKENLTVVQLKNVQYINTILLKNGLGNFLSQSEEELLIKKSLHNGYPCLKKRHITFLRAISQGMDAMIKGVNIGKPQRYLQNWHLGLLCSSKEFTGFIHQLTTVNEKEHISSKEELLTNEILIQLEYQKEIEVHLLKIISGGPSLITSRLIY